MPKEPSQEIVAEITNEINSISKRVSFLQKKSEEIEAEINSRDLNWEKEINLFNYQLGILKESTETLKMDFKNYKNAIIKIIGNFRNCAKKSIFDEFKDRVEKLNFEKLATKEQFKRLLKDGEQED